MVHHLCNLSTDKTHEKLRVPWIHMYMHNKKNVKDKEMTPRNIIGHSNH